MAYLLQIGFDNDHRLSRRSYLFEYKGIAFKLVQNDPRKWADHLLTIVPNGTKLEVERVFSFAAEFISALAWQNNAHSNVWLTGGAGWPDKMPLRLARPSVFTFPRIPFGGRVLGFGIDRIPHVQTDLQRKALALFRHANSSNNDFLAFLFFWQVLEVGPGAQPEGYINKVVAKKRREVGLPQSDLDSLQLNGRRLGNYLGDDCRNAIAHIRRRPKKNSIDIDNPDDRTRIALGVHVIRAFAQHYIRHQLGLTQQLWLACRRRGEIPLFVDNDALHSQRLRLKANLHPRPMKRRGLTGRSMGNFFSPIRNDVGKTH